MPFDLAQRLTDPTNGELDSDAANGYIDAVVEAFAASPEGRPFAKSEEEVNWARLLTEAAVDTYEAPLTELTAERLCALLAEDVAVEVGLEDVEAAGVIAEIRAFLQFLRRAYALPQAEDDLAVLDAGSVEKLRCDAKEAEERIGNEVPFPGGIEALLEGGVTDTDALDMTDDEMSELAVAMADLPPAPSYEKPAGRRDSRHSHDKAKRKMAKASRKKNRHKP